MEPSINDAGLFCKYVITAAPNFPEYARTHDVPFRYVQGFYKGKHETCYVFPHKFLCDLLVTGVLAGETTLLFLSAKPAYREGLRDATLATLAEDGKFILMESAPPADWCKVDEEVALASEAWTYEPSSRTFWVAVFADEDEAS